MLGFEIVDKFLDESRFGCFIQDKQEEHTAGKERHTAAEAKPLHSGGSRPLKYSAIS